jgi:hypothetical protein
MYELRPIVLIRESTTKVSFRESTFLFKIVLTFFTFTDRGEEIGSSNSLIEDGHVSRAAEEAEDWSESSREVFLGGRRQSWEIDVTENGLEERRRAWDSEARHERAPSTQNPNDRKW